MKQSAKCARLSGRIYPDDAKVRGKSARSTQHLLSLINMKPGQLHSCYYACSHVLHTEQLIQFRTGRGCSQQPCQRFWQHKILPTNNEALRAWGIRFRVSCGFGILNTNYKNLRLRLSIRAQDESYMKASKRVIVATPRHQGTISTEH